MADEKKVLEAQGVAEGTPEEVAKVDGSYTGQFLKDILKDRL